MFLYIFLRNSRVWSLQQSPLFLEGLFLKAVSTWIWLFSSAEQKDSPCFPNRTRVKWAGVPLAVGIWQRKLLLEEARSVGFLAAWGRSAEHAFSYTIFCFSLKFALELLNVYPDTYVTHIPVLRDFAITSKNVCVWYQCLIVIKLFLWYYFCFVFYCSFGVHLEIET